jgi:hypothetical protein
MIRGGSTTPHKRICGVMVPLSRIALITLVLCTSALVLALRYSRNRPTDDGVRYTSSAGSSAPQDCTTGEDCGSRAELSTM